MRILFVSSGLNAAYGGSAQSESQLVSALARHHDIHLLCPKERLDLQFCRARNVVGAQGFLRREVVEAYFSEKSVLRRAIAEADVCHINGHWRWENYLFAGICAREKIPYVVHPRGMFLVGHRKVWLKRLFNLLIGNSIAKRAARIIALSRFETRHFKPYPISDARVVVLPNGIPFPEKKNASASPWPRKYFLYLGRLEARKNLTFLVEAFAQQPQRDIDLCLVGPEQHDYAQSIRQTAVKHGVSDRVHILAPAYDDQKWNYLSHAVALIYPSFEEPFGRVPFEAIAAGCPPIVPDASGSAEYLEAWFRDLIYEEGNLQSLANALFRALTMKEADLRRAIVSAQGWMGEVLDWGTVGAKVESIYTAIVLSSSHANRDLPNVQKAR